jgi:serine/threonine-protein kinase RsbW
MHSQASVSRTVITAATYPGKPESIRRVRADLRRVLDGCPVADEAILCASELAANAALHSESRKPGASFTVRVQASPGALVLIEVGDDGGPWIETQPDSVEGRGLDIVRALAAGWGVITTPKGRCVWARVTWPHA